jgi:hypothetical protein
MRLALALTAAASLGALMAPGTALAADRVVTFSGGCGIFGVGSWSQPDVGALSVPAGGMVHFVNHLGDDAELTINGSIRGLVPVDNQVDVVFREGTVSVGLVPGCLLGSAAAGTVSVRVADNAVNNPPPVAQGGASPAPAAPPPVPPRPPATTAAPAPATPDNAPAPVHHPARPPAEAPSTLGASPAAPAMTGAAPATTGAAPAVPGPAGSSPTPSANSSPAPSMSEAAAAVGPAVPLPPVRRGPSGVLVLVASVCAAGVSIAAIRAMITQHAISVKSI